MKGWQERHLGLGRGLHNRTTCRGLFQETDTAIVGELQAKLGRRSTGIYRVQGVLDALTRTESGLPSPGRHCELSRTSWFIASRKRFERGRNLARHYKLRHVVTRYIEL